MDNSFDSLFLCKHAALFGSCETECILDDIVLEENAGMILYFPADKLVYIILRLYK